jgi:hypothetical protein
MNDLRGLAALALLAAACGKGSDDKGASAGPAAPPPAVALDAAVVAALVVDAAATPAVVDAAPLAAATLTIGDCKPFGLGGDGATRPIRLPGDPGDPLGGIGLGQPGGGAPGLGRQPPVQRASLTEQLLSVGDGLDKEIVRRYLRRSRGRYLYCFEKHLAQFPDHKGGTVQTSFVILPPGRVGTVSATGLEDPITRCFADATRAVVFPEPTDAQAVPVKVAFRLIPPESAVRPVPTGRRVDRRPDAGALTSALRARADSLRACLPAGALGAATLELAIDKAGAVVKAKVNGMPDAKVTACLVAAAMGTTGKPGGQGTLRCPLSFGGG